MDELHERRRRKALARLPSVAALLEMFEIHCTVRFRLRDERELLNEARRRIRLAAEQFGRPVETHYVKQSEILFGIVPLTDEESKSRDPLTGTIPAQGAGMHQILMALHEQEV